jgi:hypothetical protein
MNGFTEKLRLKEQADEDIYFARRDRELVDAIRRKRPRLRKGAREGADRRPAKIVSGGQTGVDRAALDAALCLDFDIGGWCPRGRRSQDGRIPDRYPLVETPSPAYRQRTHWNVRDSDATLVIHRGAMRGGTRLTVEIATRFDRPLLTLDLANAPDLARVRQWLEAGDIRTLNVAGPREEAAPGIYAEAYALLCRLLSDSGTARPDGR